MAEEQTNAKWNQLQEMRAAKGERVAPPADPPPVVAVAPPADPPAASPVPPPPVDAAPPPSAPPVVAAPTAPTGEEIDIDGIKTVVDPAIAEAFRKAEKLKVTATKESDRIALRNEIIEEVRASLPQAPVKSEADLAAERALLEATRLKEPGEDLLISDPKEWQRQMKLVREQEIKEAREATKREIQADIARSQQKTQVDQEVHARAVLAEQFYRTYPVFKDNEDLVNGILKDQFDAVAASGRLNKPLSAKEAESLKDEQFAEAAAKATRRIVKLMNQGKTIVPPAPPPPALASSAPTKAAPQESIEAPKEPKVRYPKGSVSALLAARKASIDGASPR